MADGEHEKKKRKFSKELSKNPWIIVTFVFAIALVLIIATGFSFSFVSKNKASTDFVDFINSAGGSQISYVSSEDYSPSLYQVTVLSNNQEVPVYVTKDGKYFVQIIAPITTEEVPTTDTNSDSCTLYTVYHVFESKAR